MSWVEESLKQKVKDSALKHALINALEHDGKALAKSVLGKVISENKDLRSFIREVKSLVDEVVEEVNKLKVEEQKRVLEKLGIQMPSKPKAEKREALPPLPNVDRYEKVVTRFSPNPDCVLHLGSARAIILSHEYARMYGGKFILRFEDTDPRLKRSALKFYDYIREDLIWLGCKWDEEYIQSDRIPIYYEHAEKLINLGKAYVCTCEREDFRRLVNSRTPCPCRGLSPHENLDRWNSMLNGEYKEGEAVLRIKTDIEHPNPAVRDWPALRIIDVEKYPHPRVGRKYRVWPLYNFACGIDDHLMGVTHIIRGKEHLTNQIRQMYLYEHLGWKYPETIHYGRLKISNAVLSKSKIVEGVRSGLYTGWSDPRLATLIALRRRGIQPEAIRRMILEVGPKPVDVTLSWENLYAYNRKIVDPQADRYFFVEDPRKLVVHGLPHAFYVEIPLHPQHSERGSRRFHVEPKDGVVELWISGSDLDLIKAKGKVRLIGLFNVEVKENQERLNGRFLHESYERAKKEGIPLIHWVPCDGAFPTRVIMPDAREKRGLAEESCRRLKADMVVQFERFGFVRVDEVKDSLLTVFYAHK
ncbi:glutamate--tRNA ligase [Candidatus Bathyarchaeota archaeon]|nr:MAG: glutamate--tRNA ligase [Candidatus Bathyarchaeota archaeon]